MNDKAQKIRKELIKASQEKDAAFRNAAIKIWDWFLDNLDSQLSNHEYTKYTDTNTYNTEITYNYEERIVIDRLNHTLDIKTIIKELYNYSISPEGILFDTLQSYICNEPGYTAEKMENCFGLTIRIYLFDKDDEDKNIVD